MSTVVGLTAANTLVTFDSATPGTISTPVEVTELAVGEDLLAMDFRPSTGELFALGSTGQIYVVNRTTGRATARGTPLAITGTSIGFDFNPSVDRLRIVTDAGEDFRINPNNGAVTVDTTLAYAAGDTNVGATPKVTAAAYSNNFASTATTTLYVLDTGLNTLATQGTAPGAVTPVSPNTGQLFTIGALGLDVSDVAGFDIAEQDSVAYAALTPQGATTTSLFSIDLTNGKATIIAPLPALALRDLSVVPTSRTLYALSGSGTQIATFTTSTLATPTFRNITGIGTDTIKSIDFRPATGQLFGIGAAGQLYTLDLASFAATAIGVPTSPGFSSYEEIDFNPVVDRVRVLGGSDENARLVPDTGVLVDGDSSTDGSQFDTALSYAAGDINVGTDPNIVAGAYTNPVAGATTTTLYAVDAATNRLVTIGSVAGAATAVSPNTGQLFTVDTGGTGLGIDIESGGIDIAASGLAYGLFTVGGVPQLYALNTSSGAATLIGTVGSGTTPLADIAIGMTVFNFSVNSSTFSEDVGNATLTVTRGGILAGSATVMVSLVAGGTAVAGTDFGTAGTTTFTQTLTFAANETSKVITIPLINDNLDEADETFTLSLGSPSLGTIGSTGTSTVTIADDDGTPVISVADASVIEGGSLSFVVTLSGASSFPITVVFATDTTGTATSADFTAAAPTTLTFAPGETTKTITVATTADTTFEGNETVGLVLSDATNASLGTATAVGTITDDDAGVSVAADLVRGGPTNQVLTVVGTPNNDTILIRAGAKGAVDVLLNGSVVGSAPGKGLYRVVILGGAGDDDIRVNSKVKYSAELNGEAGNDILVGSKGRDLLIGGEGVDALYGGAGDDILIGGAFGATLENPLLATATLVNSFLGKGAFASRADAVSVGAGTGGFVFSTTTIGNDTVRDYLFGQGSADLILSGTLDAVADEANKGRVTPV